jgi:predicted RNA-binding protein (virulence factor B family)
LNQFDQKILEALEEHGGEIPVGDKSNPEEIYALLGMSKKNFKKAVGALYKVGKVLPDSHTTKLKQ